MKKKLAVLNLIVRHSLCWVLAVLAGLVIANGAVFLVQLDSDYQSLYLEFDRMGMYLVYAVCFMLLTLVLCLPMRDRGGRQNYFLHRLNLHPRTVFWNHAVYNTFCYGLFYMVEALSLVALCAVVQWMQPEKFTHQTILLATYQSGLIHSFLPLDDWMMALSNLLVTVTMGICTAAFPARNRSRKMSISTFVAAIVALMVIYLQTIENGALDITTRIIAMFCGGLCVLFSVAGILDLGVDEDV